MNKIEIDIEGKPPSKDTYEEACQQATQWQEEFIKTARFNAIHKNDG